MKSNAIIRIVLYSLVILLLSGILLLGLGIGQYSFQFRSESGTVVNGTASVSADSIRNLEIDWAAGDIHILTAQTEQITIQESGANDTRYQMTYDLQGDALKLSYNASYIGFGSMPSKDLTLTVPEDWKCEGLEIDGAALSIRISNLSVEELDLDGAANELNFTGKLGSADIDGASNKITLVCQDRLQQIDMDGVSCKLELTLPKDCGFQAELDGLSSAFRSDLPFTKRDGQYEYGDGYCKISADGISCQVTVKEA